MGRVVAQGEDTSYGHVREHGVQSGPGDRLSSALRELPEAERRKYYCACLLVTSTLTSHSESHWFTEVLRGQSGGL
jgi:hypothetical protein